MGAKPSKSNCLSIIAPECLETKKSKKNHKKRKSNSLEKEIGELKKLTLGDWLLASPVPGFKAEQSLNGGEFYVFKQFRKRVRPSSSGDRGGVKLTPRNGFSGDGSSVSGCYSVEVSSAGGYRRSSTRRNRSGERKKSVRFREPTEFDVIEFHMPPVTITGDQDATS